MRSYHLTCMPGMLSRGHRMTAQDCSSAEKFVKGHESQISLQEAVFWFSDIFSTCSTSHLWQPRNISKTLIMLLKVRLLKTLLCTVACKSLRGGQGLAKANPCLSCTVPILCVISPTLAQAFVTCLSAMNVSKIALCCCFVFAQHLALMLLVHY